MPEKTYDIVKLCFSTPLHLGGPRPDSYESSETVLHSDTLKAALFAAGKMLYGEELDAAFLDSFRISSAFPFIGEHLFFPKPMQKIPVQLLENGEPMPEGKDSKMLKKLRYIEKELFEQLLNTTGKIPVEKECLAKNGLFLWNQPAANRSLFSKMTQERVSIPRDRQQEDPTPYSVERIHFSPGAGLFALVEWTGENSRAQLEACFRLLGDEGIGTDRSVGNGMFRPDFGSISLELPDEADAWMCLGLYNPAPEETPQIRWEQSAYLVTERGGYIAGGADPAFRHYRKKRVRMLTEASVLSAGTAPKGRLLDLRPESEAIAHPVYRDGRCVFIPVKIMEEN